MSVVMILRLDQVFDFRGWSVELQPLLVDRLGDAIRLDSGGLQPLPDSIHAVFVRRKNLMNLLHSVVLAISRRSWV